MGEGIIWLGEYIILMGRVLFGLGVYSIILMDRASSGWRVYHLDGESIIWVGRISSGSSGWGGYHPDREIIIRIGESIICMGRVSSG
jgi:hypothetical protein